MKRLFCFLAISALASGLMTSCEETLDILPNPPAGLEVAGITHDSATLQWEYSDEYTYQLVVNRGSNISVTGASYGITGLAQQTTYPWKVRAGKNGMWSEWIDGPEFTTKAADPNLAPGLLQADFITVNSARLQWMHYDHSIERYEVVVNDGEPIVVTEPINPPGWPQSEPLTFLTFLEELTPETTMTWKVRSSKNGVWSEWVSGPQFETRSMQLLPKKSDFVLVEGGTFMMGNTADYAYVREAPVHLVTVSDFYISKYEVTQEQMQAVMGTNYSERPGGKLPAAGIFYEDAVDFVTKLNKLTDGNYALPTEAQWEFAARGGNETLNWKYSGSNNVGFVAWYNGNSAEGSKHVGTLLPNELGIYDMSGNVFEWCSDFYDEYPASAQIDPRGPESGEFGHVVRGGAWSYNDAVCHSTFRLNYNGTERNLAIGLRLVRKVTR